MKLNGALKPRQGASKQGSSPGVVLKKYRIRQYFKVNKNVVEGPPLNTWGGEYKHLSENKIINSNICINNQQKQRQATTPISQQLEQNKKCSNTFSSHNSNKSSSTINLSTLIKIEKQIYLTTEETKRSRVSTHTNIKASYIHGPSSGNKNNIKQIPAAAAAVKAVDGAVVKQNKETKTIIKTDFKQRAVINITTRQLKNTKLNEKRTQHKKRNNKTGENKTKQIKYNVTSNKNNNNNMISSTPKQVNKFLFTSKINANWNLTPIILRLFIQLQLLLFAMFSHAKKHLKQQPLACRSGSDRGAASVRRVITKGCWLDYQSDDYNLSTMEATLQLLKALFKRICFKNAKGLKPSIALSIMIYVATAIILLSQPVVCDDGDTFFPINGIETTTPEFDYASRGQKKFGDKCENTLECGFPGSICDPKKKSCQCTEDLPVTNHIDKCGKEAAVNESCFFNEQCEVKYFQTECRDQRCVCRFDMTPIWLKDGSVECKGRGEKKGPETYVDPAMIGVLVGMALMFIIICVVLRLFSQARWRENRTIFNTPNPRLMNVSLLRESKLLHGQERRGSRMSVRGPSRQPSMASLRPHSPNPSLGKTGSRSNSHGSNASGNSLRSTRSNSVSPAGITAGSNSHHERKGSTYQPHQHQHPQQQTLQPLQQQEEQHSTQTNIMSNPVAETVTVEIIEPEK